MIDELNVANTVQFHRRKKNFFEHISTIILTKYKYSFRTQLHEVKNTKIQLDFSVTFSRDLNHMDTTQMKCVFSNID